MATVTVYSAADGQIDSNAFGSYSNARAGLGGLYVNTTGTSHAVGQYGEAGPIDDVYEVFLSFDTSTVTGTISAVVLTMTTFGATLDNFPGTNEVRTFDWGATLDTADFVAGASLAALTMVASWTRGDDGAYGPTAAPRTFASVGSNFVNSINQAGFSRYVVSSSKTRLGTAPGHPANGEYQIDNFYMVEQTGTTQDPNLVITTGTLAVGSWGAIQN